MNEPHLSEPTSAAFERAVRGSETLTALDDWPILLAEGGARCGRCTHPITGLRDASGRAFILAAYDHLRSMTLLHMVRSHGARLGKTPSVDPVDPVDDGQELEEGDDDEPERA